MVKITLEYPTVEAAIAAMGKLAGLGTTAAPAEKKVSTYNDADARKIVADGEKKRKARADAGVKRGSYKNATGASATPKDPAGDKAGDGLNATTDASKGEGRSPPSMSTTADAPKEPPQADSAKTATVAPKNDWPLKTPDAVVLKEADCQKAIEAVYAKKQLGGAMALLKEFDVDRVRDLKPEQRAAFVKRANEEAA